MKDTILSQTLKDYRQTKGLTQAELAELLDVSDKSISKWELGAGYPSKRNLLKISEVLDIPFENLVPGEGQEEGSRLKQSVKYAFMSYVLIFALVLLINSIWEDYSYILELENLEMVAAVGKIFLQNNWAAIQPAAVIGLIFYFFILPK